MYLICLVISHDNIIDKACKFMGGNSLDYVNTLTSLVNISIMMVMFLICHVTSCEHMFKGLCKFTGGNLKQ